MIGSLRTSANFLKYLAIPKPGGLVTKLVNADANRRQRLKLASMSDAQLCDLGLTREQALSEARLPRWDAPIQMR